MTHHSRGISEAAAQAVVRHALKRGFISGPALREALLIQEQLRAAGQPADLLGVLRARYLRAEHLPELTRVYESVLAIPATDSRPTGHVPLLPPAGEIPREILEDSQERLACPPEQDPQRVQDFLRASNESETIRSESGLDASLVSKRHRALPAAPPHVAGYRIVRELARGAFGVVYHGHDAKLDRPVAIKLMRDADLATEEDLERFQIEARAAARLRHPNIVGIHEVGRDGDRDYLIMDLIDGETLKDRVARNGPLEEDDAAGLTERLSEALYYAHSHQILHRDLKPSNILLSQTGEPLLTDFGLAKDVRQKGEGVTETGQVMGTPAYMPPEQATGELDRVDRRSDVYSLGATLFEMLTGKPPFEGPTALMIMNQVLNEEPPSPRTLRPELSRDLETICLKCLEKDPEARYASAALLGEDLRRFRRGEPILARPLSLPGRAGRWLRRNPVISGATLIVALVLGTTAVGVYFWKVGVEQERAAQEAQRLSEVRAEVAQLIASVENGEVEGNDALLRVFYDLVRRTEPEAVEVMIARLDAISGALFAVTRETYLEANQLSEGERAAGLKPVAGLEAALDALHQVKPGERLDPNIREVLDLAGERIEAREHERFNARLSTRRVEIKELIASRQGRLGDRLSAARLLLYAVGRMEHPGLPDALGRYLAVEADPSRAVPAGKALSKLGGARAQEVLFWARDLHGEQTEFWKNIRYGLEGDLGGLEDDADLSLESTAGFIYQAEVDLEREDYRACADDASKAIARDSGSVRAWVLRAQARWYLKDYKGCLDDSRRVMRLDPRRAQGWILHGRSLYKLGEGDAAVEAFSDAISEDANRDWAFRERAYVRRELRRYPEALTDASRAIEIAPQDWRNWQARALTHYEMRRFSEAESDYLRALELDKNVCESWLNLSVARWELKKLELAASSAARALTLAAGRPKQVAEVLAVRAAIFQAQGNFEAALGDLDAALEQSSEVASAWSARGAIRGMLGRRREGIEDLSRAIELDPKRAEAWLNRGLLRAELGDDAAALADLDRAIRVDPNLAHAYSQRGSVRSQGGDAQGASEDLQKALQLRPDDPNVWYTIGLHNIRYGGAEEALQAYDRGLTLDPNHLRLLSERGALHRTLKHTEKALADFTHALGIDPNNAKLRNQRARTFVEVGRLQEALADYDVSLRLDPKDFMTWLSRAAVHRHAGNTESAALDLERAEALAGQDPKMWQERAMLEGQWRDTDAALRSVGRALALGGGKNPRLWLLRAEIREVAGKKKGAIEDYTRFLKQNPNDPTADHIRARIKALQAEHIE